MSTMTKSAASGLPASGWTPKSSAIAQATHERIRARAYAIYQTRRINSVSGDQLSDWLEAEREINVPARGELLMKGDQE